MERRPRHQGQAPGESWLAPLSIDLLVRVLSVSLLHPLACGLVALCLRAQARPWTDPLMAATAGWSLLLGLAYAAAALNARIAHGPPRPVDLADEVIVVTGAASGLGLLLAQVYGMRGASVAVLDRDPLQSPDLRGLSYYKCDVADRAQVSAVAADIERELGTPTILINNAAIVVGKPFLNLSLDELDSSLATNLLGPLYCLKAFLPALIRSGRGGTIVNITSVIGHLGASRLTDYAAAKAGIMAMHRSLAAELRESHPDIRMILVAPGQFNTPLFYGVRTPNRFLAPIVEPVDVAKEIIAAIDSGKGAIVSMPFYARWIEWYHVLPVSLQLLARKLSGVDRGMDTFIGREGLASAASLRADAKTK